MSTSIPRPGEHVPGPRVAIDPDRIHAEVDALLMRARDSADTSDTAQGISRQAQLLDQAHDVLVQALATVDKI
ncbi:MULTISPECIES: hypothetical protein [unclassified Rhodococcus (in: high G+C Gram-positive bacteria)]|jgi:hypothetical protein|uniref:hypothetical protein n=1 Tax=unclassified Rhodococcus (in: high G+C Gram-positive bacteria) TaxID=192944 RepID=UPI00146B78D4|nr:MULTISPECIES: hypothetical protein [unclassified Rhodococcus (in: high G+C Gram-positive bacteria)]MBF0662969.1 hypothetical protein [Rhodococcus sp. (in: high G+C Gram-positive bacteria)]NMD97080.1 hypothetical protein [Rhodococcus sp. BL-253-APC-6A1W]NME81176.1 hypothetical protein [Rhodococcus sp. 105337]